MLRTLVLGPVFSKPFLSLCCLETTTAEAIDPKTEAKNTTTKSSSVVGPFKPLIIPGLCTTETTRTEFYKPKFSSLHEHKVEEVEKWTTVWPAENFFSPSLFPVPIRQGHSKNLVENEGLSPAKYANTELMKIPNFLHLSPEHIRKHCEALKKFTTKWPEGLKTENDVVKHYPLEVVYRTFLNSAPSIRDRRARFVTLRVPLSNLKLDKRSHLKLLRLAKSYGFERDMAQYYADSDTLELKSGRCPVRRQNYDYLTYVLTVLTMESKKHEAWEDMDTGSYLDFNWSSSPHRERLLKLLSSGNKTPTKSPTSSEFDKSPAVLSYRRALEKMFSTPTDELCGPWQKPPKVPKRRHYHWPPIRDIPFEPVVGADQSVHLQSYGEAVRFVDMDNCFGVATSLLQSSREVLRRSAPVAASVTTSSCRLQSTPRSLPIIALDARELAPAWREPEPDCHRVFR
ncbi:28S ribosomal protein S35, mitochondrial [Sparganum proliferum]